jgi:hypothetical protein
MVLELVRPSEVSRLVVMILTGYSWCRYCSMDGSPIGIPSLRTDRNVGEVSDVTWTLREAVVLVD